MNNQYTADGIKIDVDSRYEEFWWEDYKNDHDVRVAVNWNSAVMPQKALRLSWRDRRGNDQELILDREEVQTILFLLAPTEDESKYLRSRTSDLKRRRHEFHIKASRRFEKGEEIVVNKMITS